MISINDIAKKANVAKSTVSNVLSGKRYVSPDIVQRVMKVCEEYNYSPNFYASILGNARNFKTNIIGLFLETASMRYHAFYNEVIETLVTMFSEEGINVLLYFGLKEKQLAEKLKKGQSPIDAAIILAPTITDFRIQEMSNSLIPFVIIGSTPDKKVPAVDTNNTVLTETITNQMINAGYNKIALINSTNELTISKDRTQGYVNGLKKNSIKNEMVYYTEHSSLEEGFYYASQALDNGANAIIVASSTIALGVYKAIESRKLVVGKDVAVFALGISTKDLDLFKISLSHARQDYSALAKTAATMLDKVVDGEEIKNVLLDSKIIYKDSFNI